MPPTRAGSTGGPASARGRSALSPAAPLRHCGVVTWDPGGDEERKAERYDAWFDTPWGRYAWALETALVGERLGGVAGRLALDVGCGTGRSGAVVRSLGARVVGVDPDAAMLAAARGRVDAAVLAVGEHLPFPDRAFDATVAVTVLEFVPDPAEVLAEMARVTRSPGTIVVGALNPRSAWGLWHRRELRGPPWTAARFLTGAALTRLGTPHGVVSLHETLAAPGMLPGLARWGPRAERLAGRVRVPGAFRVVTIER